MGGGDGGPEVLESGRRVGRGGIRKRRLSGPCEAPVPPFHWEHQQSRSHCPNPIVQYPQGLSNKTLKLPNPHRFEFPEMWNG